MFIHSFHIFQPFNVKSFKILKTSYNKKIKEIIHTYRTHITRKNFFFAFKQIFYTIMGSSKIQTNFKTIEFIPYNFDQIFDCLDFKSHIFTLPNTPQ